jgi:Bacterial Ig domain
MIRAALLCLALVAVATAPGTPWSGADFTAGTASPANTFAAATDFNTVAVALTDPGTPLAGAVPLQATASSERGIASVRFESSPAGAGAWTTACQATSPPYTCDWSTASVADGLRDVRAVAIDAAGYQRTSAVIGSRRVDNTAPAAALADPGAYLSGTVTVSATGSDAGSGLASLAIEHRAPGGSWATLCTGAASPRSCGLATAGLPDGPYELRAVATDAAGNRSTASLTRPVDNTAPAVLIPALGAVRGSVDIPVTASDAGTGVASVTVQILLGGTWTEVCADTAAPWACSGVDSTAVADGVYQARAIAVDAAGRSTTSGTISVRVDNTAPSAALGDPGTYLRGAVSLSGTAADAGSGVASWTVQYRSGAGAWTAACSDAGAPYGCPWATSAVPDGTYDLRAVAVDAAGNSTTSAVLSSRRVDNTAPAGASITATNGGASGRLGSGDSLALAYTEQIAPASVLSGWTGAGQAIRVRVFESGANDRMDFFNSAGTTRLNLAQSSASLELGGNFVTLQTDFTATMVQSGATISITLTQSVGGLPTASAGTLRWTPSSAAGDLAGNAVLTTQVTESGAVDRDF